MILIKKAGDGSKKIKGCWDSIHVVEVQVQLPPHRSWQPKRCGLFPSRCFLMGVCCGV